MEEIKKRFFGFPIFLFILRWSFIVNILWTPDVRCSILRGREPGRSSGSADLAMANGPRLTVTPPTHVIFSSGSGVVLACLAEGSPPPTVTWVTRDGHPLSPQSSYVDVLANGSLALRPFSPDRYRSDVHAATVRCRASNPHGTVISPPVTLQAVVWQDFSIQAQGGRTIVGGSVVLKCIVPNHLSTYITPTAWETPTHTIYPTLSQDGRYQMVGPSGDLLVKDVTREDSFTSFTCRVKDSLGGGSGGGGGGRQITSRTPAKIIVQEPGDVIRPVIQNKIRTVTVPEGGTITVPCVSSATPVPSVKWSSYTGGSLNNNRLSGMNSIRGRHPYAQSPGSAVLVIENAQISDAHAYTCTANNSLGIDQMSVEVVVQTRLTVSITPEVFEADLGGTATFTCTVSDPGASITWYYNGSPIMGGNGRLVVAANQLIVSGVTHDDPGMYQCQAVKGSQAAQQTAQLFLADSVPVLHYRFIEQTIQPGPLVNLKCSAVGNPTPSIKWTLDGLPIHNSDRVIVGEQAVGVRGKIVGHVNISHTRVEDGGRYECTVRNRAGHTTHQAHLNIYGIPVARPMATVTAVAGEMLELRCPVAGYPLHSFVWNKEGISLQGSLGRRMKNDGTLVIETVKKPDDSGVYTCTASTKQGRAATGSVQVSVLVPPKLNPFAAGGSVNAGDRVSITCTVSRGDEPLTLTWLWNGSPLPVGGGGSHRHNGLNVLTLNAYNSMLGIERVQMHHEGDYTCVATNAAASTRLTYTLIVHVPPSWVLEPMDTSTSRGHSLMVDCVSRGYPDPRVIWKKKIDDNPNSSGADSFRSVDLVRPRAVQLSNGSLYISRTEPDHAGTYLCQASNSVTQTSKTVTISVNSAPYFHGGRSLIDVRAGEVATLECRVRGDSPLTVTWALRGTSLAHSARYKETANTDPSGDTFAKLDISSVVQSDAGVYTCTAHNTYGRNSHSITLNVHELPSPPRGLRVVTEGSRAVRVSWSTTEPAPSSYVLQFRRSVEGWGEARELTVQALSSLTSGGIELTQLMPATEYVLRVIAVNHLGRSQPSEDLRLMTSAEKPSAPPRDLRVEAIGATQVRVFWRPPTRESAHGTILGYYLGYAPLNRQSSRTSATNSQYNFTTVEQSEGAHSGIESEGSWMVTLKDLRPYMDYQLVVQAFNTEGAGPLSPPASVTTREDAPGGPPKDARCVGLSWDSVQITWVPPEAKHHHGVLRGYKLEYERWDGWSDATRQSQTTALTAVLTGLEAAMNYSVRVRAYTSAGDGPWSPPTLCSTEEDVPGRPSSVRGIVSGPGSFIVSWAPPARPGGRITSYTVTWRVVGARMTRGRGTEGVTSVSGKVNWVQVDNVSGNLVEVEVVAATREGKGPPGASRVTLTNTVPAAIYSTSNTIRAERGKDVTLSCGHVGQPRPRLAWTYEGRPVRSSQNRIMKGDGGLVIQESQRHDSGNYTCTVSNVHGADHITYSLVVLVAPSAPLVLASSHSESHVQVQWKQGDNGGTPVTAYMLYYRKDHGSWTQISVSRHQHTFAIKGLECGSKYHVYVVAQNVVGSSPASTTAVVRTVGGAPQPPQASHFLTPNSSSVTVFPKAWMPQGCPITHMGIEYRRHNTQHWIQVSSGGPHESKVVIEGLEPSTTYSLKVTALSSAGSTSHTYSFTTLTIEGDIPSVWSLGGGGGRSSWAQWVSLRVLLPLMTSIVALASSLGLVCYCVRKKTATTSGHDGNTEGSSDRGPIGNTVARDNKHNLAQREQYYATIRKGNQHSDRVPENAEDIYPYATFQLPEPPPQDTNHIQMYPIYQTRTSDKKIENYEEVKRRGSRSRGHLRSRSRSRSRSRAGMADSDDYETLGSETETEHGGVSSRTESSNQLDDIPSIRDHTIYARGPPSKDPRDPIYSREVSRVGPPSKEPREPIYSRDASRDAAFQQRIHHNLLYSAESSTSPEPSPTTERKSFPRRVRARSRVMMTEGQTGLGATVAPAVIPPAQVVAIPALPLKDKGMIHRTGTTVPPSYPASGDQQRKSSVCHNRKGPNNQDLKKEAIEATECDRDILLPPPRRYSDAKHKGTLLQDHSIAV